MAQDCNQVYKFIILGDAAVGKSCLLNQFTEARYQSSYVTTIGTDFKVKVLNLDGERYKLHIWDTAGQERFRTIVSTYYRGARGALIVYDVTCQDSFLHLNTWLHELRLNCPEAPVVIVGNKCDLADDREVPTQHGQEYAREHGMSFHETSAKENINIQQVFEELTRKVHKAEVEARSMDISDFADIKPSDSTEGTDPSSRNCC